MANALRKGLGGVRAGWSFARRRGWYAGDDGRGLSALDRTALPRRRTCARGASRRPADWIRRARGRRPGPLRHPLVSGRGATSRGAGLRRRGSLPVRRRAAVAADRRRAGSVRAFELGYRAGTSEPGDGSATPRYASSCSDRFGHERPEGVVVGVRAGRAEVNLNCAARGRGRGDPFVARSGPGRGPRRRDRAMR